MDKNLQGKLKHVTKSKLVLIKSKNATYNLMLDYFSKSLQVTASCTLNFEYKTTNLTEAMNLKESKPQKLSYQLK